ALIEQVDDQLELVQALEVGHLGCVPGLDQRLEARLNQSDRAAAKHGLLAEEVGLGLFAEGRFNDAGAPAAVGASVGERDLLGLAAGVLVHGNQARHAAAFHVGGTN